ncbi:nuclease-related domain-containing protein [Bacillus rubiinfantis]|uniref:nuclease-related domain-containing protein n=1 Tax=Bacillus rubiinfantis TaxID=1499680 RepID=UPI0006933FC7|nr:nuclease-related domain-containing protein [Bacillus rubiinfantis]
MFIKDILPPRILMQAEALERRLPEQHPAMPNIITRIKKLKSGYNGEKSLNFYLKQIPLLHASIFHDLRLPLGNGFFQIDVLLLSQKFMIIFEAKNNSGTLIFEKNQMIQQYEDTRKIYENPITQAKRHKILLHYFLNQYEIPKIPTDFFVTICKDSTEIDIKYPEAYRRICRTGDVINIVETAHRSYKQEIVNKPTVEKISNLLVNSHTPKQYDVQKIFDIGQHEIITGVQCPCCFHLPMLYRRMNWLCPKCHFISKNAHIEAIEDYFLLFNLPLTNAELCRFLHIPSSRTATYIFSLLNLPYTGTNRNRKYHQATSIIQQTQ